jgi:hypothetical protein
MYASDLVFASLKATLSTSAKLVSLYGFLLIMTFPPLPTFQHSLQSTSLPRWCHPLRGPS